MLKLNLEIFKSVKLPSNTLNRKLAQFLLHDPGLTVSPFQSDSAPPLQSSVPGSAGSAGAGLLWPLVMAVFVVELLFEILSSMKFIILCTAVHSRDMGSSSGRGVQVLSPSSPLSTLFSPLPHPQGQPRAWRRIKVNLNSLFFLQFSTLRDFMNSFFYFFFPFLPCLSLLPHAHLRRSLPISSSRSFRRWLII